MAKTDPIVIVKDVTKSFRIPLEGSTGLKQRIVNIFKRQKGYRVFTPLKEISFEVYPGEFFGIVGKNGSGKSTLLKTLAGIYTPAGGQVHVSGSLVPFIELGVGFNPELTGRENVYLNGALLGFNHKEVSAMYDEIVNFAELGDFMEERLKNYSSGMQVRLAFSIAIQAKGDILLLDEVLAVGDAAFQQKCFDYFEELKRDKRTIILVTHDMGAVKRFCDRAMMLADGEIEKIGTPEEVADLYTEENIEAVGDVGGRGDERQEASHLRCDFPAKRQFRKSDVLKFELSTELLSDDTFISVSFVSQGFVFANRNSKYNSSDLQLRNAKKLIFEQPLEDFNSGKYDVYLSLHKTSNDGLLEHKPRAFSFVVTGKDLSRDGPMRIEGRWQLPGDA
jgi:ABC-2 type transport system ATP-binding protein